MPGFAPGVVDPLWEVRGLIGARAGGCRVSAEEGFPPRLGGGVGGRPVTRTGADADGCEVRGLFSRRSAHQS